MEDTRGGMGGYSKEAEVERHLRDFYVIFLFILSIHLPIKVIIGIMFFCYYLKHIDATIVSFSKAMNQFNTADFEELNL